MTPLKTLILSALLALAGCASIPTADFREGEPANYLGFDGYLPPLNGPVQLEVSLSEELAALADAPGRNGGARRLRNGSATGGYLGERDLALLLEDVREEMTGELAERGVGISGDSDTVLRLMLADARPSRPTFTQLGKEASLSAQSVGRGGASLSGQMVSATTGEVLGEFTYGRYDDLFLPPVGIWAEAKRTISIAADRVAKQVTPLSNEVLVP